MSELNSGRAKAWNIVYSSGNPSASTDVVVDKEGPWKSLGSSMNAISFGFVATAILVSMFLIMAIFEHLFRPNAPSTSSHHHHSTRMNKLNGTPPLAARDMSVVMPGQQNATFIAHPAPLPCPREGLRWPSHHVNI